MYRAPAQRAAGALRHRPRRRGAAGARRRPGRRVGEAPRPGAAGSSNTPTTAPGSWTRAHRINSFKLQGCESWVAGDEKQVQCVAAPNQACVAYGLRLPFCDGLMGEKRGNDGVFATCVDRHGPCSCSHRVQDWRVEFVLGPSACRGWVFPVVAGSRHHLETIPESARETSSDSSPPWQGTDAPQDRVWRVRRAWHHGSACLVACIPSRRMPAAARSFRTWSRPSRMLATDHPRPR